MIRLSKYFFYILFIFIINTPVFAQNNSSLQKVAVFALPANSTADNALTAESAELIKKIFSYCGRFIPVEKDFDTLYKEIEKDRKEEDGQNIYNNIAGSLSADLYVLVSIIQFGNTIYTEIEIHALNQEYKNLERKLKLRSRINLNIPLKIAREIALMHKNLPVIANISPFGNNYLIDAGEWQGIINNAQYSSSLGSIQIIQGGRFESIVKIPGKLIESGRIIINTHPDIQKKLKELDEDIARNTVSRYSLEIGNPEKRLIESICCINMGGNVCLPGYGSFLSTNYLGFKNPKPDWPGIATSTGVIAMQLFLPEILMGFNINFLPWKQDPDKTERMQNMQKFLWATLPFTFSVSYMDQLAYLYSATEHTPPFFYDKDNAAAVFSLFLPGGGSFYKGHRLTGWGFYFSEMFSAGYGVYNYKENSGKYALFAFGAIKFIDIVYAYFAQPAYSFYNLEKEREIETGINFSINKTREQKNIFNVFITYCF